MTLSGHGQAGASPRFASDLTPIPVPSILAVLLRNRRTVVAFTAVGVALAVLVGLTRTPKYTASFSFLPQSAQDQSRSGLAGLAGQFGIPIGMLGGASQPPQLYADVLTMREILTLVARDSFASGPDGRKQPLPEFLEVEGGDPRVVLENTMRALREKVISSTVAARTTNAVTVRVQTRSPQVSLGIAQRLLDGLNQYNRLTRQSQAGEERRFIEARLADARASLRSAEDALQRFLQANRQFTNSPQLRFEEDRLQREVTLRQQVVVGLSQQYEDARIREVRDTPVITVIDPPALPVLPDPRGRVRLLALLTMAFFALGVLVVLSREAWTRKRAEGTDPSYAQLAAEWQRFRGKLLK